MVRSGAVDIVVVDSVAALTPKAEIDGDMGDPHVGLQARLMSQALRKLTSVIANTKCTVVFINQLREKVGIMFGNPETTAGGRALKFYASVRLDVRKTETVKKEGQAVSNRVKVKVVKNKVAPPFKEAMTEIVFGQGIDIYGEIVDLGTDREIISKRGAWFTMPDGKQCQGRDGSNGAKQYLKEHPDIAEAIKNEILGKNMDTEMADDSAPAEAGTADGTLESEEMEA